MLKRLNHIGIAVNDLDQAIDFYGATFGVTGWERIALTERHMAVAVASVGETLIELIAPTSEEAAFVKYLRERGQGVHHMAYEVDDIDAALESLAAQGVQLVDQVARPGIHNTRVAFVHPRAAMGVLIELVELPRSM
jgi:methylmalonyl-CoA/ethylmalonyl-CoA epimerase